MALCENFLSNSFEDAPLARRGETILDSLMIDVPPDLFHRLKLHKQEHVLASWHSLRSTERTHLVEQLAGIDFAELDMLIQKQAQEYTLPPREQLAAL